jgi:putative DNA primase/helicase
LGDYHKPAHPETFVVTMGDRQPTDLAMLRGARLVTVNEIEEGRRWAEAKIKSMTGGDTISARFMHQNFLQYQPQFKLMVAGNHKPSLRSVDEAVKRRMNLIPFTVTIPTDKRDPQLTEKLRAERPGILHWMLEGCAAWQREGLNPPKVVRAATEAYLSDEDAYRNWIDDDLDPDPSNDAFLTTEAVYGSLCAWCRQPSEEVRNRNHFVEALRNGYGFRKHRTNKARGFKGYRFKMKGQDEVDPARRSSTNEHPSPSQHREWRQERHRGFPCPASKSEQHSSARRKRPPIKGREAGQGSHWTSAPG